jgi:hypothetical protein
MTSSIEVFVCLLIVYSSTGNFSIVTGDNAAKDLRSAQAGLGTPDHMAGTPPLIHCDRYQLS